MFVLAVVSGSWVTRMVAEAGHLDTQGDFATHSPAAELKTGRELGQVTWMGLGLLSSVKRQIKKNRQLRGSGTFMLGVVQDMVQVGFVGF